MVTDGRRKPFFFYAAVYVSCADWIEKSYMPAGCKPIEWFSRAGARSKEKIFSKNFIESENSCIKMCPLLM